MTQLILYSISIPVIFLSLILSVVGVYKQNRTIIYTSAVLALPICTYFAASPRFGFFAFLFPLFIVAAGVISRKSPKRWGAFLIFPYWLVVIWFAIAVYTSNERIPDDAKIEYQN